MVKNEYKENNDWSGYSVKSSEKGWIIENWTRIQGCITGRKLLLPYSQTDIRKDEILTASWNRYYTNAEKLSLYLSWPMDKKIKVLRKGYKAE